MPASVTSFPAAPPPAAADAGDPAPRPSAPDPDPSAAGPPRAGRLVRVVCGPDPGGACRAVTAGPGVRPSFAAPVGGDAWADLRPGDLVRFADGAVRPVLAVEPLGDRPARASPWPGSRGRRRSRRGRRPRPR